jgi:chromosomal replication initiator protein
MMSNLRTYHAGLCRQWFEELVPLGINNCTLEVRAGSTIHRDYLSRACGKAFNEAAQAASGTLLTVLFLGPDDPASITEASAQPVPPSGVLPRAPVIVEPVHAHPAQTSDTPLAPKTTRAPAITFHDAPQRYDTLVVNPDFSFENFVVGPNNRLAHAAALGVASSPGRLYNPLFIHGDVGLGKTHILQAICLKILENCPDAVLYYTSCEGFVTQYFESMQNGDLSGFRQRFRDVDVLIIDDIHFLTKRDRSQDEFFHTFNSLYHAEKQIILSCDAPPEEIPDLEDRLVSRFMWGLVAKINPPDYETRIEILRGKARLRGVPMPDDVAEFIAARIATNIRELEGAIVKLQVQSMVEKKPVSLALAREALGDMPLAPAESSPTMPQVVAVVTEFYNVRLADLQGKERQRSIALPRHVAMYLARKCTKLSLEEVGRYYGGRDHTTVMHAMKTVENRMRKDTEFWGVIQSLEQRVRGIVNPS